MLLLVLCSIFLLTRESQLTWPDWEFIRSYEYGFSLWVGYNLWRNSVLAACRKAWGREGCSNAWWLLGLNSIWLLCLALPCPLTLSCLVFTLPGCVPLVHWRHQVTHPLLIVNVRGWAWAGGLIGSHGAVSGLIHSISCILCTYM